MKKTEAIKRLRAVKRSLSHRLPYEIMRDACRKIQSWISVLDKWKVLSMINIHPYLTNKGKDVTEEVERAVKYWESFEQVSKL